MSQNQPQARPVNLADFQARAAKAGALSLIVLPAQFAGYEPKWALDGLPEIGQANPYDRRHKGKTGALIEFQCAVDDTTTYFYPSPLGGIGDLLWAREAFWVDWESQIVDYVATMDADAVRCAKDYKATKQPLSRMPLWASRFSFDIAELRIIRFNDLTEADARAMGTPPNWCGDLSGFNPDEHGFLAPGYRAKDLDAYYPLYSALDAARLWWNAKHRKHRKTPELQTDANPWVWAYSIKPAPTTKESQAQ